MFKLDKLNNDINDIVDRNKDLQLEVASLKERLCISKIIYKLFLIRQGRFRHRLINKNLCSLEQLSGLRFNPLTEEHISYLLKLAYRRAEEYFGRYDKKSPFIKNGKEKDATIFFQNELSEFSTVNIVPAVDSKNRRLISAIPIIGIFVPDLLIQGLEWSKDRPIVCVEVDGKVHEIIKAVKDEFMERELGKLGILTIRLKTNQVFPNAAAEDCKDFNRSFAGMVVADLKTRKLASNELLKSALTLIHLYTIATWLEPRFIDKQMKLKFGIDINLNDQLTFEHYKPYRPDWVRGAKRRFKLKPRLSNGLDPRTLFKKQTNEKAS